MGGNAEFFFGGGEGMAGSSYSHRSGPIGPRALAPPKETKPASDMSWLSFGRASLATTGGVIESQEALGVSFSEGWGPNICGTTEPVTNEKTSKSQQISLDNKLQLHGLIASEHQRFKMLQGLLHPKGK